MREYKAKRAVTQHEQRDSQDDGARDLEEPVSLDHNYL